ncbi:HTH-type transcriptional regulator MalT [Vibrio sp. TH_r3]|uniref:HTH-type transcriptional regulator MalT n=1 Tax=Vibrio sp. TH_r3 TaxID=3082084 RepID=UPI0029543D94|nr:HTH-type transcriptional regulator MalT [Vibrio sp. TH_r3]MDV7105910.1 HTH-type transcriptional regulator MalT [Vibrio sp. TH_r3]
MLIPSKLTRPSRLHNAIMRPRVLDLLQQAPFYKLVLFRSPAGYGKTTMATQWLANKSAVGWFSIDNSDNDSNRFADYFIHAINKATNNKCPISETLAKRRQFSSLTSLFEEIFVELSNYFDEFYVALDDYHLINSDEIHEAMRFFIKNMPDNMTLVVTSRSSPPLGTANLRVRDLMLEIDNQALAFDTEETTRFFNQRVADGIDDTTAYNLQSYVEGWPSALQLIALQAQYQQKTLVQSAESVAKFNHAHLWDYLIEEVFDILDSETKNFLMRCSILETFNDTLVNNITNRTDSLAMIESLNRFGLFIYRLEGEQNWYRFHHLFAEFLTHQRKTNINDEEVSLHRQAAETWLKLGVPYQALFHAQNAQDSTLMSKIILDSGWKMFNRGDLKVLDNALNKLDSDLLYSDMKLPLLRAWLSQSQHRYNEVEDMLTESLIKMEQQKLKLTTTDQGQVNALLAQISINKNDPQRALEYAELALSQLDTTIYHSRIVAISIVGEVNHVLGQLERALPLMQQTEKLARQHQLYHQALWAILQQSEILVAQGFIQAAFEMLDHAFKLIEDQKLQQLPLHEFALRLKTQILWCWNRLDEAEHHAYTGIEVLGVTDQSKHLHSYSMLARIAVGRGELDKATKFITKIEQLLTQSSYHLDWTANASLSLILYWQARNDIESMQQWLASAIKPTDAKNHFLQLQWRNIIRVQIYLGEYEDADTSLSFLTKQAADSNLISDINRNLVMQAILAIKQQDDKSAREKLEQALIMTNQTSILGDFLIDGGLLLPVLQKLINRSALGELEKHRAQQLINDISDKQRSRSIHFDEEFIHQLLHQPNVPELVRTSPLTQREWQVLGLIYSGFSNEQIAQELDVAGTTIKTHIRNLYQKLNITNRKNAIEMAENLINLIN